MTRYRSPLGTVLLAALLRGVSPLALSMLVLASPAVAQDQGARLQNLRGAAHEDYGRMVFDWDRPVGFTAQVSGTSLVVRFSEASAANAGTLLKPLGKWVKGARRGSDGRSYVFTLAAPHAIRSFTAGTSVVVDVLDAQNAVPPSALPNPAPKPAPNPAPGPVPAASTPAASVPNVAMRSGEHTGYNRLVFDWPSPVEYSVAQENDQATISFAKPGRLNAAQIRSALPSDVRLLAVGGDDQTPSVTFAMPATSRIRHFRSGPKVVIDIVRAAGAEPPPEVAKGAKPVPLAPPPGSDVAAPSVAPPPILPGEVQPGAVEAGPGQPGEVQPGAPLSLTQVLANLREKQGLPPVKAPPEPVEPPPPAMQPAPLLPPGTPVLPRAKEAPPPPPEAPSLAETAKALTAQQQAAQAQEAAEPGEFVSLSFNWDQPAAAAVFRRAGWLWVVFDRAHEIDERLLRQLGGDVVLAVEQIPVRGATAVRILTRPGFNPSIRREKLLWILDLTEQPMEAERPLSVQTKLDTPTRPSLVMPSAEAGGVIEIKDPEVGDTILVATTIPKGQGVFPARAFPGAKVLASAQGVAVVPNVDGVEVKSTRAGIEITAPRDMLKVSPEVALDSEADDTSSRELDPAKWKRGGIDTFVEDRQRLLRRLGSVTPERLNDLRLELARHSLANGLAADALGTLAVIAEQDPGAVETGTFRAVRGAANFLLHRDLEALTDLHHPSLDNIGEVMLWRGAVGARIDKPGNQALLLKPALDVIKEYSKPLKFELGQLAATALLDGDDPKGAKRLIDMLSQEADSPEERAKVDYLQGRNYEELGTYDAAVQRWLAAEDGPDRPIRAKSALRRIETLLRLGKMSRKEAIEGLERLRFAWRGEEFEYPLLKRLGMLQIEDGDYGNGLRTLRQLATVYSEHPDIGNVAKAMTDAFKALYVDGKADSLSPVTAIGLYDEFRELTPTGPEGDEMIRKLADRVAAVDLLDRAAELLRHQVNFRLTGLERARVGTRLALIELLNDNPRQALEALQVSDHPAIPDDLQTQRRHLLARSLDEMGRAEDALALLATDPSRDAVLLRAEMNWRRKNWGAAAEALETLLVRPEPGQKLSEDMARLVLDLATAQTLANQDRALARIKRLYGPFMEQTRFRDAFNLLTSDTDRGLIDYRKVADKIKEVESFQVFMSAYRKRLQDGGLSTIN